MPDILIVDDDQSIATAFEHFLRHEGHDYRIASDAEEALRLIQQRSPNLVMMDVRMPGRDGLQTLQEIRSRYPDVYVVIMTAYGSSQTSIDAIRVGAFDYLTKPLDLDQLRTVIDKATAAQRLRAAGDGPSSLLPRGVRLIGDTPIMLEMYKLIGRLATNDVPALLVGERGTGKEVVARTIHENSSRAARAFLAIDCATIDANDAASSFGSHADGTVLLANVEQLPLALQSRLATALSAEPSPQQGPPIRARVLASTEQELFDLVRSGAFSPALYDLLSVVTLRLPPLRDRRSDIPTLVSHFIQRFNDELGRTITGVDETVARQLHGHSWPGNVGELERIIKRACIVARSDVITSDEVGERLSDVTFDRRTVEVTLSQAVRTALQERLVEKATDPDWSPFHEIVDRVEQSLVEEALTITNGNQVKAADLLRVNRATLRKKMSD